MADLIERTPELSSEKKLEQQVEKTVGPETVAEPASAENLELIEPMVEGVKQGGESVAVEAVPEATPQPGIANVLEDHSAQNVVNAESSFGVSETQKQLLSKFLEKKLDVSSGDVLVGLRPDADKNDDLPLAA